MDKDEFEFFIVFYFKSEACTHLLVWAEGSCPARRKGRPAGWERAQWWNIGSSEQLFKWDTVRGLQVRRPFGGTAVKSKTPIMWKTDQVVFPSGVREPKEAGSYWFNLWTMHYNYNYNYFTIILPPVRSVTPKVPQCTTIWSFLRHYISNCTQSILF